MQYIDLVEFSTLDLVALQLIVHELGNQDQPLRYQIWNQVYLIDHVS